MEVRKLLLLALLVGLTATGALAYVGMASSRPQQPASGGQANSGEVLVENIQFPGAVLSGIHRGGGPVVTYALTAYGPGHTTVLAYTVVFAGVAEVANRALVARAAVLNATWSNSDFRVIRHDGKPVGLAMLFRLEEPIYIEYANSSGQSGYYEVNMTVAIMAFYHPGLRETIMAVCGQNRSLVVYQVEGGIILAVAFRISGWPSEPSGTRLLAAFGVRLRAAAWLGEGKDKEKAAVKWVVPFCGSTRPRLVRDKALIRGVFAFLPRAAIANETGGWEPVRAACLYVVKGFVLKVAIAVPKASDVIYPAVRQPGQ